MLDDEKVELIQDIFIAQKDDKYLFLNPNVPDWIVVNPTGANVLSLCQDKVGFKELLNKSDCNSSSTLTEADVQLLLEHAQAHSILLTGDEAKTTSKKECRANGLRIVHLKLTDACNLRCTYCYAESGSSSQSIFLSDASLGVIAKEVKSLSPQVTYVLSGGEPLLNSNCIPFAQKMKAEGNDVHLLTNGILVDDSNAKVIADTFDLVKISLDGASEETHAKTRGDNNYNAVTRAINLLINKRANILVAMTVTQENFQDISIMVETYGSRLTFQPFFNAGRGLEQQNKLALTGSEYYAVLASVPGVNPMGAIDRALTNVRGRGVFRCAIGESEISIAQNGDVFPCQLLDDNEFKAGNVFTSSLSDIYNNSTVLTEIKKLNVNTISGCDSCPIRLICGSGCRARTFHEHGKLDISGDFCEYERLAYINGIFNSTVFET